MVRVIIIIILLLCMAYQNFISDKQTSQTAVQIAPAEKVRPNDEIIEETIIITKEE